MRVLLPVGVAALAVLLVGCAPAVALQPAPDAASPLCAEVTVRLPDAIGEFESRETDAQATGAWGQPVAIVLHCGVPSPAPTATFPCVTVEGIDWLRDDTDAPSYIFTTYGREPAVEVVVDSDLASGLDALTELAPAVGRLPVDGACITPEG